MIVTSKGISIGEYFIPPFNLSKGEIVVINLHGGSHFYDTEMQLVDIFTGKVAHENVTIHQPLTFVFHFPLESTLKSFFFPLTVGAHLKKNGIQRDSFFINKKTKINTLSFLHRRLLSLYTVFSKTNLVIFDLVGLGPQKAGEICDIVKDQVRKGGAAILLDNFEDMKDDCTTYITLEVRSTPTISPAVSS